MYKPRGIAVMFCIRFKTINKPVSFIFQWIRNKYVPHARQTYLLSLGNQSFVVIWTTAYLFRCMKYKLLVKVLKYRQYCSSYYSQIAIIFLISMRKYEALYTHWFAYMYLVRLLVEFFFLKELRHLTACNFQNLLLSPSV